MNMGKKVTFCIGLLAVAIISFVIGRSVTTNPIVSYLILGCLALFVLIRVKPMVGLAIFMLLSMVIETAKGFFPDYPLGLIRDGLVIVLGVYGFFELYRRRGFYSYEDIGVTILLGWVIVEVFNPNLANLTTGMQGLRGLMLSALLYYFIRIQSENLSCQDVIMKIVIIYVLYNVIWVEATAIFPSLLTRYYPEEMLYSEYGYVAKFGGFGARGFHILGLLMAVGCVAIYFYLPALKSGWRIWGIVSMIGALCTLPQSLARASLIAGAFSFIVLLFLTQSLKRTFWGVVFLSLGLLVISFVVDPVILHKYQTLRDPFHSSTMVGRYGIWSMLVNIYLNNPLGLGPGATGGASQANPYAYRYGYLPVDNLYLKLALEYSIIGLAIYLSVTIYLLIKTMRNINKVKNSGLSYNFGTLSAFGGFVIYLVTGLSEATIDMFPACFLFWIFAALLVNNS